MSNLSSWIAKPPPIKARFVLLAASLLTLLLAMWAGLLRLDLELPWLHAGLALAHGPLMAAGFLGVLISLERAVALNRGWAYFAPALTAAGTLAVAAGVTQRAGPALMLAGSIALAGNFVVLLRRQPELFLFTMAMGSLSLLAGNALWFSSAEIATMVHWWAGFLVLTIAGERLELSRLSGPNPRAGWFVWAAGVFVIGLVTASLAGYRGLQVAGAGMLLLTAWLLRYDVVRRTIRFPGLSRFIAIHLLFGYGWLAVGGALWLRADRLYEFGRWQSLHYDAMLHAIFLGFVFSMIFAHAPIIFPAITGWPLDFHRSFYLHGLLLQLSVLLRVGSALAGDLSVHRASGVLNVLTVLVFLANNLYSLRTSARPK